MGNCVEHQYSPTRGGYGQRKIGGVAHYVHRIAYCDSKGVSLDSIKGLVVRHTCDNPKCVNPDHLEIGTHQDNMADKAKRRRVLNTVLTEEQVKEIRLTCVPLPVGRAHNPDSAALSMAGLARKFGVNPGAVRQAYLGLTFKHV